MRDSIGEGLRTAFLSQTPQLAAKRNYHGNSTSLGTKKSSCFSEWPLRSYTAFSNTTFLTHPMIHDVNLVK